MWAGKVSAIWIEQAGRITTHYSLLRSRREGIDPHVVTHGSVCIYVCVCACVSVPKLSRCTSANAKSQTCKSTRPPCWPVHPSVRGTLISKWSLHEMRCRHIRQVYSNDSWGVCVCVRVCASWASHKTGWCVWVSACLPLCEPKLSPVCQCMRSAPGESSH